MSLSLRYFPFSQNGGVFPAYRALCLTSCGAGGSYSKEEVWTAVLENAKTRPHVDCEHLDGEQYIKAENIPVFPS